jgi:hypothetical protein
MKGYINSQPGDKLNSNSQPLPGTLERVGEVELADGHAEQVGPQHFQNLKIEFLVLNLVLSEVLR